MEINHSQETADAKWEVQILIYQNMETKNLVILRKVSGFLVWSSDGLNKGISFKLSLQTFPFAVGNNAKWTVKSQFDLFNNKLPLFYSSMFAKLKAFLPTNIISKEINLCWGIHIFLPFYKVLWWWCWSWANGISDHGFLLNELTNVII